MSTDTPAQFHQRLDCVFGIIVVPRNSVVIQECEQPISILLQEAVSFTGDPETAIRALATLYKVSSIPVRCNHFAELFMTHPALVHRATAMARVAELPAERVAEMLLATEAP